VGGQITVTASIDHFSSGYVGSGNPEVCADRYEIEAGEIVRDTLTDLRWRREAGFLADNFGDSEAACQYMLGYGDYNDWRLPTVRELLGLVSGCGIQMEGCCMPDAFGECGSNAMQLRAAYWTGTVGEQENSHYAIDYSTCDWSYSSQPDGGMVGNQIASFHLCVAGESTACQPMCGSRECGPDPVCGISCGTCGNGHSCQDGECVEDTCVPDCGSRECGSDPVCGISCGTCGNGHSCQDGECVEDTCVPDCGSRECGLDPVCGTQNCGTCDEGYSCDDGECIDDIGWEPDDYTVNCINGMCLIPAGSFWMGCNSMVDGDCSGDEKPYHEVTLSAYFIDKTEVTQGEYKKCVDAGECGPPSCNWDPTGTPNRPVVCVDWTQAGEYCAWAGKRLPTEAEWEKAARGTDGRKYPWGNEDATCDYSVMDNGTDGCGTESTWDVCSKSPAGDSPYGLCDMSGNVWEWVSDWYDSDYYSSSPTSNPTGPDSGSDRVRRGGSFDSDYDYLRASNRSYYNPSDDLVNLGFRCSRSQ